MKEKKTKKLVCVVTGKTLTASKDYYAKKVAKAESEEVLHKTYICQDAKQLLKKGYDLSYVRDALSVDKAFECTLTESEIKEIVSSNNPTLKYKLDNQETVKLSVIKSDPDVKQFIQNILED